MSSRIIEDTPCSHGYVGQHNWSNDFCAGGSRRVLEVVEPDYEAAEEWMREIRAAGIMTRAYTDAHAAKTVVDAALAGGRIVKEAE